MKINNNEKYQKILVEEKVYLTKIMLQVISGLLTKIAEADLIDEVQN